MKITDPIIWAIPGDSEDQIAHATKVGTWTYCGKTGMRTSRMASTAERCIECAGALNRAIEVTEWKERNTDNDMERVALGKLLVRLATALGG